MELKHLNVKKIVTKFNTEAQIWADFTEQKRHAGVSWENRNERDH
jgi:hypothetical protein